MKLHLILIAAAAALCSLSAPAVAQRATAVAGEKIDSGLGSLPHYSRWADPRTGRAVALAVPGESLDSGLGELPLYRLWVDRSGQDPMGTVATAALRNSGAKSAQTARPSKMAQASN